MEKCLVFACELSVFRHQLCKFHYHQKGLMRNTCTKTGCSKPLFLSLLCKNCFLREYGVCAVKNCNNRPYCSQKCRMHYRSKATIRRHRCQKCSRKSFVNGLCSKHILPHRCEFANCSREVFCRHLCVRHYFKVRRQCVRV